MAALDEEIRRKKAEAALLDNGDGADDADPDPDDNLDPDDSAETNEKTIYAPATKKGPSYVLVPLDQVGKEQGAPDTGHIDLAPPGQMKLSPKADETSGDVVPPGHIDLGPPVTQKIYTAPEEEDGGRYVIDQATGQMIPHAELATEADKATFKPSDVTLPQVNVTGAQPVRRAELVDPDPDLLYMTPEAQQPEVRRAAVVGTTPKALSLPNAPLEPAKRTPVSEPTTKPPPVTGGEGFWGGDLSQGPPGTHPDGTENEPYWPKGDKDVKLLPPGATYVDPKDQSVKTTPGAPSKVERAQPVVTPTPTKPEAPLKPSAPKPRASEFGLTPDEYKALTEPPATTTTTVGPPPAPPMNAPNGKAPVALIIHHTSGRGDAASVVEDWRTHRPGVGAQMIIDRDGTLHYTQKEFGYNGTGNFLHSVIPGVSNQTAVGVEVVAKDDADMTPAEIETLKRIAGPGGAFATTPVYGHSQVSPGDRDNEGVRGVAAINEARAAGGTSSIAAASTDQNYISGRATTFGHFDPDDPGVGALKLGKINTNDPNLIGLAVPQVALERFVSQHPADWRKARVEVVTNDGRHLLVPIVDLGPKDTSDKRGVVADFTYGLNKMLGNTGEQNYQFRIIPNAGPDVMKDPQRFADEQAAIAKGIYTGPKPKAAAKASYVLAPMSPAESVAADTAKQYDLQGQQDTLTALHDNAQNMPAWYHSLEKPIPGVSDALRNATREDFKQQITAYAQDYYKESDPDKAFARIMQAPNLLTSAGEILTKAPAHVQHALLAWGRGLDANGENRIIDFINKVHPEATPEARAGFVREILSKPAGDDRNRFVSELYASVNPQITQGIDLPTLLDSIDTISQPGYQEKRKAEINAAVAKNLKDLRTDPTMENTWGGTVSDAIAQMPKNLGEALIPVIGQSAMTSEIYFDTLDGLRKEHPDWSEEQLRAKAGAASVPQVVLQEVVNLATMGLGGGAVRGITNLVQRIAANSILHGGIAAGAGTAQQAVANVATERPITEGLPQAAFVGGIQGLIGGVLHVPEARPRAPEATKRAPLGEQPVTPPVETGPKGGEVRGAEAETMATGGEPEVRATEPEAPVQPSIEPAPAEAVRTPEAVPEAVAPPPLPPEAHTDQNIEQRNTPPVRTPEEAQQGMTEEEANAYLDKVSNEVEARHQARAGDIGLIPGDNHPQATVHSNLDPDRKITPGGTTFTTAKGSTYVVHDDGTTTRNKAFRPEHGEAEQGIQERSHQTIYVKPSDAQKLGEIQTRGGPAANLVQANNGQWGLRYREGKDQGKFERRTMVSHADVPAKGLVPVEIWDNGRRVHFGNEITEIRSPGPERFSLGAEIPQKGLSILEAGKVADTFREQFPHAPDINIVASRDQLPQHLQDAIAQHAGDHAVEALIHDSKIHVVAGENVSSEQLHKALLEESIGHYGVEQVLGNKFNHLADVVSKSMTGHPQYEALKAVYGDDPHTLAAEYIARAARGQIESPSVWAHVKTWFNQLARKLGFKRAFSDSELRVLLSRARGRLEKGGGRSTVSLSPPRFRLSPLEGEAEIARPSKEELPGKRWYSPSRLAQGPRWIRSAYDQLSAHPHTAGLATALMHRVDRAQELRAQWSKPIIEALKGVKKGELKTVLADFAKLQEAKDNKQPQPTGLHPDAYKLERAVRSTSEQVAELAKANKILVFDPRLYDGKGGYRPFRATSDYVPRNVKREVIDAMRLRNNGPKELARWTGIVHEFINKGYAKNEAEVIDNIKGAANLDTRHIDSKMGNLEKARVSRLPSNMYEYSLSGMLDYIRRASDRMSEVEAYGQRGEMFQKTVDRIEASPLAGSEQGNALINTVKAVRNRELGLNEPGALGKAMAIQRSFATGADLSGWMGMFNDLIGSVSVVPSHMGIWNTAKGYYHALTHFHQMMHEAENLGVIHEDYGRATREIEHDYQTGSLSDKLGRLGSKTAELGMAISGRTTQEKFIRTMTLGATKQMLRNAVDTIRKNPTSRQAGAWAHYLHRRGVDVSKVVAEGGEGPETNRLLRRGVADTQAGYDLIQRSPWMESPAGKFFGQYMSWGVNQTRNVMREIVLPILRPTQKTIDITVNGKKYTVSDSRFTAIQRGLMLAVAGSATGMLTDQLREFFLGRIQSYRDLKQLAADIASHPDKAETFAHLVNSMTSELLTGGMTGMLGNFAQLVMDPTNKQRYKDPLHPTGFTKFEQIGQFLKRSMQEGQYNSHEADALLKNLFGVYREGKPIVARTMSTLGYSPDWVKEERTRQTVAALRNTLRRYNDEQGLGLKPPAFSSDYDASKHTPVAQSVVDALYRGDAVTAKKILADYMKAAPNAAEAKARKDSVTSSVQSATPLKLGSKSNKEFAQGFWDWAQKEGNVTPAQIADYKKAVNDFADTAFNAGFRKELQIVPEEGDKKIVITKRTTRAGAADILREMIRKENAAKALLAH